MKTNAMRILDSLSIEYAVHTYEWDEEHLDAIHAAQSAGLELEKVYKTIVMQNSEKKIAEFSVSLKKAKMLTQSKEIDLIKLDDMLKITGYIRGGCSPLGMKKQYPTLISELAEIEDTIYVRACQRVLHLEVKPDDLVRAADAEFADFI